MSKARSGLIALCACLALGLAGCGASQKALLGEGYLIEDVELEGVEHFSKGELLAHLFADETSWIPTTPDIPYDEALVDLDLRRIEALYHAAGFYEARALSVDAEVDHDDREVDLRIRVEEGRRTQVVALSYVWEASSVLPPEVRREVEAEAVLSQDGPFSVDGLNDSIGALRLALQKRGYPLARVRGGADIEQSVAEARVRCELDPGPAAVLAPVRFEGLIEVPEYMCEREVRFAVDEPFSPALLEQMERALKGMRVFSWVSVLHEDSVTDGRITPVVRLSEAEPQRIRIGGRITLETVRWQEQLNVEYTHTNLFGHLTRLDLTSEIGWAEMPDPLNPYLHGPVFSLEPRFTKKGILEDHLLWELTPRFDVNLEEGYQYYSPSNRFGVSRWFAGLLQLGLSHNLGFTDFFNVSPELDGKDSLLGRDFRDPFLLSFMEAKASFYLTDSLLEPANGLVLELTYDLAGGVFGGHFDFHKLLGETRIYWQPLSRLQLATRFQTGVIIPYGEDAGSPIRSRFYLGGASTVRGWGARRLSPRVEDCDDDGSCSSIPVGGYTMVQSNVEFRLRAVGDLFLVAFADLGDVQAKERVYVVDEWNYTAGPGLRYDSPLGLIRLDVGFHLNDPGVYDEPAWALHFGIGEAF